MTARDIGQTGESLAKAFLEQRGLTFIEQNFSAKTGEIDLIFRDKKTLVFVEVKNRKDTRFGTPAECVTPSKQKKIINTANYYLQKHSKYHHCAVRFDVIALIHLNSASIDWIPNAFMAEY